MSIQGRRALTVAVLGCCLSVIGVRSSFADGRFATSGLGPADTRRTIQFGFVVENTTGWVIDGVEVGVFIPVKEAAGQDCCEAVWSNFPSETVRVGWGEERTPTNGDW